MSHDPSAQVVALGDALLDLTRGTLIRGGRFVPLRSKSFRVLCELARKSGRVVTKEELFDAVWPGITVTEDSLTQAVRDIRRSLGDDGQRLLRTVARRGFILCPDTLADPASPYAPPTEPRPRIAVLPLIDRTGDPHWAPLVEGLAEEVTNGLARFRNLTVVARHSAFAAAREGWPLAEIGRRLHARYVVDGTARLSDGHVRLTLALNDPASGEVLWGDSFDAGETGWRGLRDLAPQRIVARLFTSVEEAGYRSSLRQGTHDLTAFEHLAHGKALFRRFEPGVNERALGHFAAAIAADPSLGVAQSYHALADLALHDYALAPLAVKQRAKDRAMQGVEISPDESRCRSILGYCHAQLAEFDAAEREASRAMELNPCDADAVFGLAIVLVWRGDSETALAWIDRAKDMNPLWPAYYDTLHSEALLFAGRYEDAARAFRRLPHLSAAQEMRLAATLALAGDLDPARHHAARARAAKPDWDFVGKAREALANRAGRDLDHLVRGIELALALVDDP